MECPRVRRGPRAGRWSAQNPRGWARGPEQTRRGGAEHVLPPVRRTRTQRFDNVCVDETSSSTDLECLLDGAAFGAVQEVIRWQMASGRGRRYLSAHREWPLPLPWPLHPLRPHLTLAHRRRAPRPLLPRTLHDTDSAGHHGVLA